jgi:hypothetical protein
MALLNPSHELQVMTTRNSVYEREHGDNSKTITRVPPDGGGCRVLYACDYCFDH